MSTADQILNAKRVLDEVADEPHKWFVSAGGWGDGKSVCLWMLCGSVGMKIARFQSKAAAITFIRDFKFPVSDRVEIILNQEGAK